VQFSSLTFSFYKLRSVLNLYIIYGKLLTLIIIAAFKGFVDYGRIIIDNFLFLTVVLTCLNDKLLFVRWRFYFWSAWPLVNHDIIIFDRFFKWQQNILIVLIFQNPLHLDSLLTLFSVLPLFYRFDDFYLFIGCDTG